MNFDEFTQWTRALTVEGRLSPEQADDVLQQRRRFDNQRQMIENEFPGRVVGFVADELVADDEAPAMLDRVMERFGLERQLYFEWIGERILS